MAKYLNQSFKGHYTRPTQCEQQLTISRQSHGFILHTQPTQGVGYVFGPGVNVIVHRVTLATGKEICIHFKKAVTRRCA